MQCQFEHPERVHVDASLIGGGVAAVAEWFLPPVPTTNWRIPVLGSGLPAGSTGVKRS
jgi:hypothetical protein